MWGEDLIEGGGTQKKKSEERLFALGRATLSYRGQAGKLHIRDGGGEEGVPSERSARRGSLPGKRGVSQVQDGEEEDPVSFHSRILVGGTTT